MSRTVLVLTATGTTGSATVRALARHGAQIRAATRDPEAAAFPAGVTPVRWSYDDPSTWPAALRGVDAVYLAAPPFRPDDVELGRAIVAQARDAGVARIVKLSALRADQFPASPHRQVEQIVEASGAEWVHLRPNFFNENFIEFYGATIRDQGAIYLPAGDGKQGLVAADDIGEAAAVALLGDATGQAWELTGPESLDHTQVAEIFSQQLGKPVQFVDIPAEAFRNGLLGYGMSELAADSMVGLYDMTKAGVWDLVTDDIARVTGKPPQSLADWVRAHANAWR